MHFLVLAVLVAQAAPRTSRDAQAATEAATAAQHAAEAAQQAAQAAQKAVEVVQRTAEALAKAQGARDDQARDKAKAEETAAKVAAEEAAKKANAAAEAAVKAAPPNPVTYSGTVALGLIALTGNSQTITFSTNAAFERKSPEWIWGLKANAAYGQTTAATGGASQVTALLGGVQARGDRRFNETVSVFVLGGIDTDHLKSIESRPFGEGGVSLLWFDDKVGDLQKSTFRTDLGFRYGHEYRFLYYGTGSPARQDGVDIVAPHLGAFYRYAINKDVIFTDDASVLENLVGTTRALVTNTAKISSRLTERVGLGVGFAVGYDSAPPAGKQSTDTALTVGLEIGL